MSDINLKPTRRILVFGGTEAAYYFVIKAIKKGFEVIVFSDPFRLCGKVNDTQTFKEALIESNVEFIETTKIDKDLVLPYINDNTLGFSIVTFWIFNIEVVSLFSGKFYNYHGAMLPEEKGGGTFTWKILCQSYNGGLTIHKIDKGLDTGPIVLENKFTYPVSCTKPIDFEIFKRSYEKEILDGFLLKIFESFTLNEYPQKPNESFYWPLLNTSLNGIVDWSWSCNDIRIFINAFDDPYEGASTKYGNTRVYLKDSSCLKSDLNFHPFQSGIIVRKDDEGIYVSSLGGILKVGIVLDTKHENITKSLKLGERLYSTPDMIKDSFSTKAKYGFWGVKNKVLTHKTKNNISMQELNDDCIDMTHKLFTDKGVCLALSEPIHQSINDTSLYISNLTHLKKISSLNNTTLEWIIRTARTDKEIGLCRVLCDFINKEVFLNLAIISSYNSEDIIRESYEVIFKYCLSDLKTEKIVFDIPWENKIALATCEKLKFHQECSLSEEGCNKRNLNKSSRRLIFIKDTNA